MRFLKKRGVSKCTQKSQLERLLMRQCMMLGIYTITGLAMVTASTWALFAQKIPLGTYKAEAAVWGVRVSQNGETLAEDTVYLTPGPRNKFVISAVGNGGTGFCYVYLDGEEYVTETLESGDKLTFYVKVRGEQVYETATGSVARYRTASGSEADAMWEDELEEALEMSVVELMIVPQAGISPFEEERMALADLEEAGFVPADIGELEYVISDDETLYCGEAEEYVPPVMSPGGNGAAMTDGNGTGGGSTAETGSAAGNGSTAGTGSAAGNSSTAGEGGQLAGGTVSSSGEAASGGEMSSGSEAQPGGDVSSGSEALPGGEVPSGSEAPSGGDISSGSEVTPGGDVSSGSEVLPGSDVPLGSETPPSGGADSEGETPSGSEVSSGGETPSSGEASLGEETPSSGEVPSGGEESSNGTVSSEGGMSSGGDIPLESETLSETGQPADSIQPSDGEGAASEETAGEGTESSTDGESDPSEETDGETDSISL